MPNHLAVQFKLSKSIYKSSALASACVSMLALASACFLMLALASIYS